MDATEHKPAPYILIWLVLLVLTLAEVGYAFLPISKPLLATGLILMAIMKAALVALYYMHLRWEPRRLWLLALTPLPLAVILVVAVVTEF
jgi:cytochrome c oxidase subunit 4